MGVLLTHRATAVPAHGAEIYGGPVLQTDEMPPCPNCGADELRIEMRLRAKPIGTFSIAGASPKVVATEVPWLVCGGCGVEAEGHR